MKPGWTEKAGLEARRHSGQLTRYGYHLNDPNTERRAAALVRAYRVYGPKNLDMKLGFLEGINYNNPTLHRRARMDAQYVRWISGKNVPLPPGYPNSGRIPPKEGTPSDGYRVVLHRESGRKTIDARVFDRTGHYILTERFRTPQGAMAYRRRMEEK